MKDYWEKVKNLAPTERRRIFEVAAMVFLTFVLVALSRLEGRLFELSERLSANRDFILSIVYFGLININVILILILSFLIFRNVIKLVVERRRGVIGSKIRTKLVVALVFFALAPTALLFYVSTRFITESFETWFSSKVEDTMVKTREAGALVYKRDKRRVESLAKIALQRIKIEYADPIFDGQRGAIRAEALDGFEDEYHLNAIKIFDVSGRLLWGSQGVSEKKGEFTQDAFVLAAIDRFLKNPGMTSRGAVEVEHSRDVVKGIVPIREPKRGGLLGVIITEERFETQIIRSVEAILKEFADLRPSAQLIRLSYTILLVVIVLIILFSATWLGFYVAREILAPIQSLAEATHEVAIGNYGVVLKERSDDEMGQLVRSFNRMIKDLKSKEDKVNRFTQTLEKANIELESRRKYMEIILRSISAGVVAVDANERLTSVNHAAEKLLGFTAKEAIGKSAREGLGEKIYSAFWKPILDQMDSTYSFLGQIEIEEVGHLLTLQTTANRIFDENNEDLGIVVIFDDASEQAQAQRVAAWREVARRIAHEIKNPITPIKLCAQRLLRKFNSHFPQEQEQKVFDSCLETIISEVDGLRNLVNEFSKFSHLPSVKTTLQDINQLILDSIGHYQSSYPHIAFVSNKLAAGLPPIPLDREQISRVFGNLISNAIAAIPESAVKGRIEFRTILLSNLATVRIEIADNGTGIPEKLKHRVLEPYFSTKSEGTGLGLAIVNQIVTDHGGYLRIEDNHPSGTLMVIELPVGRA